MRTPPRRTTPSPAPETPRLPSGAVTGTPFRPLPRRVTDPAAPRWRRILAIAWPVVLANLFQSLTLTVDLIFVGFLGAAAMAAAGVATQVYYLALALGMGIAAGATALVARAFGAGDAEGADAVTWHAGVLALVMGLGVTALVVLSAPLLAALLATDPAISADAATFLTLLAGGIPGSFVAIAFTGALQGAGDTRPTLVAGVLVNTVNLVLDWLLVFGNLGFPELGLQGAAVATAIANVMGALYFLALLARGRRPVRFRAGRVTRTEAGRILRVSLPASAEHLLLSVGFSLYVALILEFGAAALAAHQIGLRVQSFAFLPGFGFSAAAGALVGQALGAGAPGDAEADGWGATRLGLGIMVLASLPLALFAAPLSRLFTDAPQAVTLGATWIRTLVLAMPAIAVHFTVAGALRGAGDTRWPLLVSFVGLWVIRLPLAWALAVMLGWGMLGIWAAYVLEYYARAAATLLRFRGGRWKTMTV